MSRNQAKVFSVVVNHDTACVTWEVGPRDSYPPVCKFGTAGCINVAHHSVRDDLRADQWLLKHVNGYGHADACWFSDMPVVPSKLANEYNRRTLSVRNFLYKREHDVLPEANARLVTTCGTTLCINPRHTVIRERGCHLRLVGKTKSEWATVGDSDENFVARHQVLLKLVTGYPDLTAHWLITGRVAVSFRVFSRRGPVANTLRSVWEHTTNSPLKKQLREVHRTCGEPRCYNPAHFVLFHPALGVSQSGLLVGGEKSLLSSQALVRYKSLCAGCCELETFEKRLKRLGLSDGK